MSDALSSIAAGASSSNESRTSLADNFELFLTLLTEQLKNQDPLDPLDSNEFVNQLVDFSGVEQAINQTETLESLLALQGDQASANAVSYIERDVVYEGDTLALDADGRGAWTYTADGADTVSIAVLDESGGVVFETSAQPSTGRQSFDWDGVASDGTVFTTGVFTLSIAALDEAGDAAPVTTNARGRVTGVDFVSGSPVLDVSGVAVALGNVRSVTQPTPPSPTPSNVSNNQGASS